MTSQDPTQLHPRRGPHDPAVGTAERRPGSARRTTSIDLLRPAGLDGPVRVLARGRDLLTRAGGEVVVLHEVQLTADVAYLEGMLLTALRTEPPEPALDAVVGSSLRRGFRSRVQELLPAHRDAESVLFQLLDDLPVATMVSGHALTTGPRPPLEPRETHPTQDICAGWRTGGTIMLEMAQTGRSPVVVGPVVSPPPSPQDPLGWHPLPDLPPGGMRRLRRTDLWEQDGRVLVETFFRDSHRADDGPERAVHEYTATAAYDPAAGTFTDSTAIPGALPWQECPAALASASSVVGLAPEQVRGLVRRTGTGTCTHLTDQLRSLSAVPALLAALTG